MDQVSLGKASQGKVSQGMDKVSQDKDKVSQDKDKVSQDKEVSTIMVLDEIMMQFVDNK